MYTIFNSGKFRWYKFVFYAFFCLWAYGVLSIKFPEISILEIATMEKVFTWIVLVFLIGSFVLEICALDLYQSSQEFLMDYESKLHSFKVNKTIWRVIQNYHHIVFGLEAIFICAIICKISQSVFSLELLVSSVALIHFIKALATLRIITKLEKVGINFR